MAISKYIDQRDCPESTVDKEVTWLKGSLFAYMHTTCYPAAVLLNTFYSEQTNNIYIYIYKETK